MSITNSVDIVRATRKNGGDLAHFTPQTVSQRIAQGLLDLKFEEGLKIGEFLKTQEHAFAETPTQAILMLLAWAHHEVEGAQD